MALKPDWNKFVVRVTPEMASEWLTRSNPRNRNVNRRRIASHSREMTSGKWMITPLSAIAFNKHGMLLNGHHRLRSIVASGITCDIVVFNDVDDAVLRVTDTELPRSNVQIGKMFSEDVSFDAALKAVVFCRTGGQLDWFSSSDMAILRAEFSDVTTRHPDLASIKVSGRKIRAGAVAGFLLILKGPVSSGYDWDGVPSSVADDFLEDFRLATDTLEAAGGRPARLLVKFLENSTGKHARLAYESAAHVAGALRQYSKGLVNSYIKPGQSLLPYLPKKHSERQLSLVKEAVNE